MAKFEELKVDYLSMDLDERMAFILEYTNKRSRAIAQRVVVINTKKAGNAGKGTKKADQKVSVTPEQLQLLQSLGLI